MVDAKVKGLEAAMGNAAAEIVAINASLAGMSAQPASTQLGLKFAQKQYNSRMSALTEPGVYATNRETAHKTMVTAVDDMYEKALKEYLGLDMPLEMAKGYALQAAANERAIQQQIFESKFPSGANILEQGRRIAKANVKKYPGAMPTRRRAPTRRRPARRRR